MTCHACGTRLESVPTSVPFKVDDDCIVIIKNLPVLQCGKCPELLIDDRVAEGIHRTYF